MFPGIKSCRGYCPVVPILDSQPSARTLCSRISIHGEIEIGYDADPVDVTWLVQDALDRVDGSADGERGHVGQIEPIHGGAVGLG